MDENGQPQGTQLQPGPWTQDIELVSTPNGVLVHVTYRTASTHLHLFGKPEDWRSAMDQMNGILAQAGQAVLLPPGTVMPIRPEDGSN